MGFVMPWPELVLAVEGLLPLPRLHREDLDLLQSDAATVPPEQAVDGGEDFRVREQVLGGRSVHDAVHAHLAVA